MNLDLVKKIVGEYCEKEKLNLFEVNYHKSDSSLCIVFDEKMDMDQIEKVSNDLSTLLDQYENEFEDNYILDVSTVGIERPIRNEEELIKAVNSYIYVKTKESEHYGTLLDYTEGIIHLECMDKTRKVNVSVPYNKVKKARYAYKF